VYVETGSLIPQLADRMKLDRVLAEAHQFFVQFPIDSSNRDALDMPLRTVKTVLNSIVQAVGEKILPYLPSIEKNGRSDAAEYVRRVLREVQRKQNQLPGQTEVLNDVANRMNNGSARSLADIFKVVSNKDTAEIGISQLHEWIMANPNGQSQMDQYLKSSTPFLRSFVEQGLSKRNETAIPHPSTVREGSQSAAALTRLHALRSQAGLADEQPRYNNIPAVPRAAFSLTSVVPSTAGSETRTRMPPEALADLKSRLDAVKRRSHMPSS